MNCVATEAGLRFSVRGFGYALFYFQTNLVFFSKNVYLYFINKGASMKTNKIAATFKYGRVWGNFALSFIIILATVMTFGFAYFAVAVLWKENLTASGFSLLVDIFLVGLFAVELIKGCKNRLYAKKCLSDAIEITTVAKFCDKDTNWGFSYKGIKILVSFHYQNKKVRKQSIYDLCFRRYIDKEVRILYSPTYDEVLLCKESKNEKY